MEKDSGVIIILTLLAVFVFLLIAFKTADFIKRFRRDTEYIISEMNRAESDGGYRYWRRELRCHYLCLIPFVTERNVMRLYRRLYHKTAKEEKRSDGFGHIIAPSVIAACVCAVCLCGVSWAWFTASSSSGTATIQSAAFAIENVQIAADGGTSAALSTDENGRYTTSLLAPGTYTLSFHAAQSSTSTNGYCCITVFENGETAGTVYYTVNVGSDSYTLTVKTSETAIVKIEPVWGNVNDRISAGTPTLASGSTITVGSAAGDHIPVPDNTATTEPAEDREAVTTPESSPSEIETGTPETSAPSAASTEPEESDSAEQTAAPETAAAEETGANAAHAEPVSDVTGDGNA